MNYLLIYSHQLSNRLRYITRIVFSQVLNCEYKLIDNIDEFKSYQGPKLNYSYKQLEQEAFISANEFIFQTGIKDQDINVFRYQETSVFFSTSKNSILPFDVFSASFFMLSRYEEYLPCIRDDYDRFEAKSSLAYQNNFLQIPVVNYWCLQLKQVLLVRFPDLVFKESKFTYLSTIDIDNAYAYKEKGFLRTLGAYAKSLLAFDIPVIIERTKVLIGLQKDPYDTYGYQDELHKKYRIKSHYFFLVGDYGVNDTNVPITSRLLKRLIKSISDNSNIGIHPSYASSVKQEKFSLEIDRLEHVLNKHITSSRQHFLRLRLPDTYRRLLELDISDDYTMGFASELGFRAGICTPFYFYDLDNESETRLMLHPFAFMEATLKYYLKLKPEESIEKLKPIIQEVKNVNGTLISLWHNESLSDWGVWKGWKGVYEEMIIEVKGNNFST